MSYIGSAAFVPLDYGSRYEHSVILIPGSWSSMFDLIKEPVVFLTDARDTYLDTPKDSANVKIDWNLKGPITVVIQPLTIATSKTIEMLTLLSEVLPGSFDVALAAVNKRPSVFKSAVLAAALGTSLPGSGVSGQSGMYVAEFCIDTRILNILYIPPQNPVQSTPNYLLRVTPVTRNVVTNSKLRFIHFDVDFGDPSQRTHEMVATARAHLAMDYIANQALLNRWLQQKKINLNANTALPPNLGNTGPNNLFSKGWFECVGSYAVASSSNDLKATGKTKIKRRKFIPSLIDPTVIIDSVWPDWRSPGRIEFLGTSNVTLPPGNDPPPHLCVVVVASDGPDDVTSTMEVKYYP